MSDQGMHLLTFVFGIAKQTDIDHMKTTIDEISAQDATTKLASKAYKHTLQLAQTVNFNFHHTRKMIQDLHSEVLLFLGQQEKRIILNFLLLFESLLTLYGSANMQITTLLISVGNLLQGHISPITPDIEVYQYTYMIHLMSIFPLFTNSLIPSRFWQTLRGSHINSKYQLHTVKRHPYQLGS